jgi:prevent-host-death family protein
MVTMTTVDAREHFSDVVNRAAYGKERVGLLRHGKQVAVVVPVEDLALLERLEEQIDLADARIALAEARLEGTASLEDLAAELGL